MASHYAKLYERMSQNKDSIFEPCLITEYNGKHVTANVYCLTSQQYRDRVPVLFPSLYLNRGHISPPAPQSTGLLFWGSERQAFVMPAQFIPSTYVSEDGVPVRSGSPSLIDPAFTIEHIEGGEHHISSLRGAYIHLKNVGDAEIGTSSLYRFSLSDTRQNAELVSPSFHHRHTGYESTYGVSGNLPYHHERIFVPRSLTSTTRTDLVQAAIDGTFSNLVTDAGNTYWTHHVGVVKDGEQTVYSAIDHSLLFRREQLHDEERTVFSSEMSRQGTFHMTLRDERYQTHITIRPGSMQLSFVDTQAADPDDQVRSQTFGF